VTPRTVWRWSADRTPSAVRKGRRGTRWGLAEVQRFLAERPPLLGDEVLGDARALPRGDADLAKRRRVLTAEDAADAEKDRRLLSSAFLGVLCGENFLTGQADDAGAVGQLQRGLVFDHG
jgi:hypothetical protein